MERDSNTNRRAGVPWPVVGVLLLLVAAGGVAFVTGVFKGGRSGQGGLGDGSSGPADPGVDNESLALSDSDAKYLQDAEHLGGFVLGDLTLPRLSEAIREGNASVLAGYLAKGFRAELFVPPGEVVYKGMIVGENSRDNDMVVNPTKEKKLTNVRAAGSDDNILLKPPRQMTLEMALEYIEGDEFVEVTPGAIRLRKIHLTENARKRNRLT